MGNQQGKHQHNQSGKPKKMVHWKSAERPSPPGRPILIPLTDEQPDIVNLHWDKPKLDGGSPITGYVVEHRRMGSPHWVRATPTPVAQCEVSLSGLEPGWRYQFRAFAENVVGRSDPSELSDPLTVTLQRNAISVPRFIDELVDTQAVEDERIEFRVRILGQPPPEINWFKDGYEIFSSRRTKILNDNETSVLIIHQVALSDEGEIKCTATNRAGHVVTKAKLEVQAPPKIRLPRTYEDGLIVEADEVLRLKVGVAGQPAPQLTWLHEGDIIPNAGRFEIVNTDRNSMLKIDNVKRDDRGEYSIRAANNLGEDLASFLVTVTARPDPPGKVRLNMSFGKSATLSWTAPIDDGGCKIGNYIVEYFRVGWNVWLKATTTRQLSTTLNDLFEGSEYKFRVKAENPYGVSEPSEESDVLFIPDPKRGITKPKSAIKLTQEDPSKPVPPRRKTLSPSRPQVDASTETPRLSPLLSRKPKPQVLDNEDLHREMSYGTPDQVLKMDVRKSPSVSSADSKSKWSQKAEASTPATPTTPSLPTPFGNKAPTVNAFAESIKAQLQQSKRDSSAASATREPQLQRETKTMAEKAQLPQSKRDSSASATREPQPQRETKPMPEKPQKLQPPLATPERSTTPEVQKAVPAPAKSPSFGRRPATSAATATTASGKASTPPEFITGTAALQRSAEPVQLGVNQNVRRYSGQSMSPIKNASALAIAIATGYNINEGKETVQQNGRPVAKVNGNGNGNDKGTSNGNGTKQNASTLTNPTIQISAPAPTPTPTPQTDNKMPASVAALSPSPSPPPSPNTPRVVGDKHDDVHTSNEFMLVVFDKRSKVKDKDKQDSFELDLEDALQPPPISISSPELASLEYTNLHPFPLRRSVSSTELLYERAMARFYEAVELEEAEKTRKLSAAQDKASVAAQPSTTAPTHLRKRLGSMTEAERLSFEWRAEQRRQSADITQDLKTTQTKWNSRENIASMKPLSRTTGVLLAERQESQESEDHVSAYETQSVPNKDESFELGSDYTESTASTDEDSIEKFKMELLARTRSPSPRDLDTYHPRDMAAGVFTPYRAPTPDEAALVLNRPMPLPSPDFVPKPILKRPSIENVKFNDSNNNGSTKNGNGNGNGNGQAASTSTGQQSSQQPAATVADNPSSKLDIAKGIKSFFKRDKRTATERNTEENQIISNPQEKQNAAMLAAEQEAKRKAKEAEEEAKRKEAERLMLEEAHAAVDHYSDIVQTISSTHKYHKPLYLDPDELKKAAEKAARESTMHDEEESDQQQARKRSESPDMELRPPVSNRPRLSISERGQMQHVRQTASELAVRDRKQQQDTPSSPESQHELEYPSQVSMLAPIFTVTPPVTKSATAADLQPRTRDSSASRAPMERVVSETRVESPDGRGRTRIVKVKRIIKRRVPSSSARSRDASVSRPPSSMDYQPGVADSSEHLSMVLAHKDLLIRKSNEQLSEEAHEKVRSALSYSTDLVLFVVACYVYLFKDARLVLPILALMIYRQLGEVVNAHIPNWMKRKRNN